ncbi:putative GABA permease [Hypoxylon trugodes]|uniref:putative GABA permease n=1 Tax=Hypoxylon trugodes TaxID=326681 RepID=UPI0021907965|nr:putative GABA permease [Hypoxylon trugodes]KAI1391129.1 putative GABA permease [Hypoxylon trugodes]
MDVELRVRAKGSFPSDGVTNMDYTTDERDLLRLGKRPVLKASIPILVSTQSLLNGGPAGVIWGYLIVWVGTLSTFTVLSELASMAPTAGGQYHWVAMLAPDSSRRFLSYITGWMTFAGWQAVTASAAYLIGTLLQGVIVMVKSDYTPEPWQAMLFLWAVLAFSVFINTVASKTLAHFEGMAEEIKDASIVVPRAIVISIVLNGILGFAMLLAYLFCLGNLDAVLDSQAYLGYPFLFVFLSGTKSKAGAAVMGLVIVALGICSTVGVLASSSRMLRSFSRDRGIPFWRHFMKLASRTSIPIYTIAFTATVSLLLSLIILGSSVAFNNIVNLSVVGLYSSYLISCSLLLWRRLQPQSISPYDPDIVRVGPNNLHWGPWRIPGVLGILNNAFACIYLFVLWFWAFWPPATPVDAQEMNFSVLTFGFVALFAVIWHFVQGKKEYKGPIVEIDC